jgi:hypothetical protein
MRLHEADEAHRPLCYAVLCSVRPVQIRMLGSLIPDSARLIAWTYGPGPETKAFDVRTGNPYD